jgi:hypothetical protein
VSNINDQPLHPAKSENLGGFPLTMFTQPIPPDYLALAPEAPGNLIGLCIVHPPMAAVMAAMPEQTLESIVLPSLQRASMLEGIVGITYNIRAVTTDDGLYLLYFYEG